MIMCQYTTLETYYTRWCYAGVIVTALRPLSTYDIHPRHTGHQLMRYAESPPMLTLVNVRPKKSAFPFRSSSFSFGLNMALTASLIPACAARRFFSCSASCWCTERCNEFAVGTGGVARPFAFGAGDVAGRGDDEASRAALVSATGSVAAFLFLLDFAEARNASKLSSSKSWTSRVGLIG